MIKYYPADKTNAIIGLKFPLNSAKNSGGLFNFSMSTEEQSVTNYINLLLTRPGERYYHPNYGVGLQLYIFEPNTDYIRNEIEFKIRQQCNYWLPYIINHDIKIHSGPINNILGLSDVENSLHIVIVFSVGEYGANKTITVFQKNGIVNTNVENL